MKTMTLQSVNNKLGPGRVCGPFIIAAFSLLLATVMTGCASFPVTVNDDPFKGVKNVSVDMWHTVLDSDLDNIRTLYQKKITRGEVSDPIATIVFVAAVDPYYGYDGHNLSRGAYILVDSVSFPVDLIENRKERVKHNSTYHDYPLYFGYPHFYFGYPHFFFYYPGVVVVKQSKRYILTARLRLTPDIQSAITGAGSYKIRLYLGETPVTLEATARQLEALKQFITYGQPTVSNPVK